MKRRDLLRTVGAATALSFLPGQADQAWARLLTGYRPANGLSSAQLSLVSVMADAIIPRTDTPGATDVGVPAFIDRLYGEFMTDAERRLLIDGLAEVEKSAMSTGGRAFARLAAERQDAVLLAIARAEEGREESAFRLFRSATVLGYFTSEEVGRKVLNYDPVPGRYDGCVPIEEVGRRNWTT